MNSTVIEKKSNALKKYIDNFVNKKCDNVEDIHNLRTKSRELLSLLSKEELFYSNIKKTIKLSNNIRDIDVFVNEYLQSLSPYYSRQINTALLLELIKKDRKKEYEELLRYLKTFSIPNVIHPINEKNDFVIEKCKLKYNKKKLHKFRIYIKKLLYNVKNNYPNEKNKIELLTQIKDLLGSINDNKNALKRLNRHYKDKKILKVVKRFTKSQNKEYYKKAKILVRILSL